MNERYAAIWCGSLLMKRTSTESIKIAIEEYAKHVASSFSADFAAVIVIHLDLFATVCRFPLKSSMMLERFFVDAFFFVSESLKKRA